jgi:ribosomal protein S18 acetylase RimI-like enzyme
MQVRRLEPAEWETFRAIRLRALADAPDAFGSTLAEEAALADDEWRARAVKPDRVTFVVDGPDGPIAMAMGGPAPDISGAAGLYGMWVDPTARRGGLGAALVDAVKAWAIERGYALLGLGVTTTNEPAIALYRRLGFADTGDRHPLREGTDLTIQIMGMALA